jgi:hypothetical protein
MDGYPCCRRSVARKTSPFVATIGNSAVLARALIRRQSAQIAPVDGVVARTLERLLRTRSRTVKLYGLLFATDRRSPVLSSCHVGAYIPVGCQSEPTGNQQDFVAAPLTHRREEWQRAVCMIWLEHSTEEDVHLLAISSLLSANAQ